MAISKQQAEFIQKIELLKSNDSINCYCLHPGCIDPPETEDLTFPHCYIHNPLHKGNQTEDTFDIEQELNQTIEDLKKQLQEAQNENFNLSNKLKVKTLSKPKSTVKPTAVKTPAKRILSKEYVLDSDDDEKPKKKSAKRAKPWGTKCKKCDSIFGSTCGVCKEDICDVCSGSCSFCS